MWNTSHDVVHLRKLKDDPIRAKAPKIIMVNWRSILNQNQYR